MKMGESVLFPFFKWVDVPLYKYIYIYIYKHRTKQKKQKQKQKNKKKTNKQKTKQKNQALYLITSWKGMNVFVAVFVYYSTSSFPSMIFCKWDYVQMPGKLTQKGESTQVKMKFTLKASKPKGRTGCVIEICFVTLYYRNVIF